ncbi:Gfo/Idh/MocA family oxidoreductase [candidate division KSB1 bacterium]|nr:Gfo/Idh/MocA family oxidoreductase [candidate division KSB1 bacterium]
MKKDPKIENDKKQGISRRDFIGVAGAAAAAFTIVPRHVLGGPGYMAPSDMINVAGIGIGGMGQRNIMSILTPESVLAEMKAQTENPEAEQTQGRRRRRRPREPKNLANIYALCDVDTEYGAKTFDMYPKAKIYKDFREMLDKEKEIDAVVIATPDHTHAVIAMYAMKMGKHVYCQKPLTRTIKEARMLAQTAKEMNVITQMGNQGHASEGARLIKEWIQDGAIGTVQEVHAWTNRPVWPQGNLPRPEAVEVPANLDWDLWLGPAPLKGYHPDLCHFNWRGWQDYGTGAVGDMGAHLLDHPFWALDLNQPVSVQSSSTKYSEESFPEASMVTFEFPKSKTGQPPIKLTWYDGGLTPARPNVLEDGRRMGFGGSGVLYYGDKGALIHGDYGNGPRLIPETAMEAYKKPEPTLPRSPGIHEEWIEAIKNGGKSTTDFSYSGRLTETMLLGNVAILNQKSNTKLLWDSENMQITNLPEANEMLHYEYREGWKL